MWIYHHNITNLKNIVNFERKTYNFVTETSLTAVTIEKLTRLLRQTTGHSEQPNVQQQHIHPQNNHLTLTGRVFLSTLFRRVTVALYSSGATCSNK